MGAWSERGLEVGITKWGVWVGGKGDVHVSSLAHWPVLGLQLWWGEKVLVRVGWLAQWSWGRWQRSLSKYILEPSLDNRPFPLLLGRSLIWPTHSQCFRISKLNLCLLSVWILIVEGKAWLLEKAFQVSVKRVREFLAYFFLFFLLS